jgi:hypothetical protein
MEDEVRIVIGSPPKASSKNSAGKEPMAVSLEAEIKGSQGKPEAGSGFRL